MNRRRLVRPTPRWRMGLLLAVIVAVPLMHVVSAVCAPAPDRVSSGHHAGHGARGASMAAVTADGQASMTSADSCDAHDHACVFVRADDPQQPIAVLVLLVWGFALLSVALTPGFTRVLTLGRPPPWAMPDHLALQVIRC